jgi:predicted negative regulator of RcsB-dependent stress response
VSDLVTGLLFIAGFVLAVGFVFGWHFGYRHRVAEEAALRTMVVEGFGHTGVKESLPKLE